MQISLVLLVLAIAHPAAAQERSSAPELDAPQQPVETWPAEPVVAGQRQNPGQLAREAGITPMGRVDGRIENRVQSRINNRLDRNYRPAAPPSPGEQVRRARDSSRR